MMEIRWRHILEIYRTTILWMLLNVTTRKKIYIVIIQDTGEPGDKVQDGETKIQHIVTCTGMVYATVQDKTSARLINVILDSRGTPTVIN